MKQLFVKTLKTGSLFCVFSLGTSLLANDLKTDVQKASYAIGQQIGGQFKAQDIEVDVGVLTTSIQEAMKGQKSRLSEADSRAALEKLQESVKKKMTEKATQNKEKGKKFLEENKKKQGVVTTKTGLQYEVVKEGKGQSPKDDSKVKVNYAGTLLDGTEFDSSYARNEPAEFQVNQVIPGWTEALKLMKVGSVYNLTIPSELAYGESHPGKIPPNSVLKFKSFLYHLLSSR